MKTKFTFVLAFICLTINLKAQITQTCYSENFNTQTSGWTYSQGASEGNYNSPGVCTANRGIITPGIGGNNPANIFTPLFTSTGALTLQLAFDIYCVNSNLSCNTWKDFGCPTSIDVFYYVGTTRFIGFTDLVLPANGPLNSPTVSFNFSVGNNLPQGTQYKVEIAFKQKSGIGNCGQPGTKYILDNFNKCEITCINCAIDAINDDLCGAAVNGETFSGNLALNDSRYQGADVTYSLANGPFANGSAVIGGATLVINNNGTFTLTRTDPTKTMFDFTYRVVDNDFGYSDLASASVCFPVGGALPVLLTDFTAKRNNDHVVLNWKTAGEINANRFEIERMDADKFMKAGSVAALNLSTGSTYSFMDKNNSTANTQYRLKMIDNDGKFTYSAIRVVKGIGKSMDIAVYPNPTNGASVISLTEIIQKGRIQLMDQMGRVMRTYESENIEKISVRELSKGIYLVRITNMLTGEQSTQKLVVN